jgi:hypothetical protein
MLHEPVNEERYTDISTGNVFEGHYSTVLLYDYVLYHSTRNFKNYLFYDDLYFAFLKMIGNDNINALPFPFAVTPMC